MWRAMKPNEWVMPIMKGYKTKCCGCGLVHELDFNVARWRGEDRVELRARLARKRKATVRARE